MNEFLSHGELDNKPMNTLPQAAALQSFPAPAAAASAPPAARPRPSSPPPPPWKKNKHIKPIQPRRVDQAVVLLNVKFSYKDQYLAGARFSFCSFCCRCSRSLRRSTSACRTLNFCGFQQTCFSSYLSIAERPSFDYMYSIALTEALASSDSLASMEVQKQ